MKGKSLKSHLQQILLPIPKPRESFGKHFCFPYPYFIKKEKKAFSFLFFVSLSPNIDLKESLNGMGKG
jgi:hypothetical protein